MIRFAATAIAIAGAGFMFWDDIQPLFHKSAVIALMARLQEFLKQHTIPKRQSLKKHIYVLEHPEKKSNFVLNSYRNMQSILAETGAGDKLKTMKLVSLFCGLAGVVISIYLGSYMLVPILGIGCALLPMWLTKFKAFRYNVQVMQELSVVLSMVTNSYIRSENIVKAMAENVEYINPPVKVHFEWFVHQCTYINSDVVFNIQILKTKIDNAIFRLWCDCLIICQNDINQKASLNAVVEQFTTDRELLNLLAAEITKPVQVFALITICTFTAFPLTALMGTQFGVDNTLSLLFNTLIGQCIVVGYAIVLLFGINRSIDLSTKL